MSKKNLLKEKIGEYLTDTWDELVADIEALPPKERAMAKLKLMDYHLPKVQAVKDEGGRKGSTPFDLLQCES